AAGWEIGQHHVSHCRLGTRVTRPGNPAPAPALEGVLGSRGFRPDDERRALLAPTPQQQVVQALADTLPTPGGPDYQIDYAERATGVLGDDFLRERCGQAAPPGGGWP